MRTLEEVRDNCFIDDEGHWVWRGAKSRGLPRICAPDYTRTKRALDRAVKAAIGHENEHAMIVEALAIASVPAMTSQPGRRALAHIISGEPLPNGWRSFATCPVLDCLAPEHTRQGTTAEMGRNTTKMGRFKRKLNRMMAGRLTSLKRASLTIDQVAEVRQSNEMGSVIAARLGVSATVVSRARLHRTVHDSFGMFSGLMR